MLDQGQLEKQAFIFKNISHPIRLDILQHLQLEGELSVDQLQERLKIDISLLQHHLFNLKIIGLLSTSRDGKIVHYRLKQNLDFINLINLINSMNLSV